MSEIETVEVKTIKLSNGVEMPMIGLGTFRTDQDKENFVKALKIAIKSGVRHIDGAWLYNNDTEVGIAVRECIAESEGKLKREDLFIVGKVWNTFHSKDLVRKNLEDTLSKSGLDYLDLYLVHWPMGFAENMDDPFPKDKDGNRLYSDVHYIETYHALEELCKEGKVKSIGVSNFNISQLKYVLENCEIKPVNNQIEVNPYLQNDKLIEFCQQNNVVVSCYGPIGAGQTTLTKEGLVPLLENPTIVKIANKYNKGPAQVCLRWGIQRNLVMLPKSINPKRIIENAKVFDFNLSDEEMNELKSLNQNYRVYGVVGLSNHKFYPFHED